MAARGGGRPAAVAAVRGPAQRDGTPLVQAPLDPPGACARRAVDVRAVRELAAGAALLAVAAGWRDGLALVRTGCGRGPQRVRDRLGGGRRLHLHDQSLRPVRAPAGVPACARRRLPPTAVHRARPLPATSCSASGSRSVTPGAISARPTAPTSAACPR